MITNPYKTHESIAGGKLRVSNDILHVLVKMLSKDWTGEGMHTLSALVNDSIARGLDWVLVSEYSEEIEDEIRLDYYLEKREDYDSKVWRYPKGPRA